MDLLAKVKDAVEGRLAGAVDAFLLGTWASVMSSLPYLTETWRVSDIVACVCCLGVLAGLWVRYRRGTTATPADAAAAVAASAPNTAIALQTFEVRVHPTGRVEVKVSIRNSMPHASVVVDDVVLCPVIPNVPIAESEVKRSAVKIEIPPLGTASFSAHVDIVEPALGAFKKEIAAWAGFLQVGVAVNIRVSGPWGAPAPFIGRIADMWYLADGNLIHEIREERRKRARLPP